MVLVPEGILKIALWSSFKNNSTADWSLLTIVIFLIIYLCSLKNLGKVFSSIAKSNRFLPNLIFWS